MLKMEQENLNPSLYLKSKQNNYYTYNNKTWNLL